MIKKLCDFLFGPPPVRDVRVFCFSSVEAPTSYVNIIEGLHQSWAEAFKWSVPYYLVSVLVYDSIYAVRV